jgi:putative flippase GtrA
VKWFRHSSARYVLAGSFLFVLDFVVYFVLAHTLGIEPGVAQFVSRGTGALVGFFVHRDFSFRTDGAARGASRASQGTGYTLVTIGNLLGSPFLVHWSVAALGGQIVLGKLAVDVFLVMVSYVVLRILFRARHPDPAVPEA